MTNTLRFVLGDQLSLGLSSLRDLDKAADTILMVECADECAYVPHHPKKIAFILSAMRHFAEELRGRNISVDYVTLTDPANTGAMSSEVARAVERLGAGRLVVTECGEWRLQQDMERWKTELGVPVEVRADDRFICSIVDFKAWADGRERLTMEYFYREMRRKTGLLMEGERPVGGQWNLDQENRKKLPRSLTPPMPFRARPDAVTQAVLDLVRERFPNHYGKLDGFHFAVTAAGAEQALQHFIDFALPLFGDYQDAMKEGEPWVFHSILSPYINAGLLDPLDVCGRAEAAYHSGRAPLNAVEGFIRQIIGWREYVRGVYWLKMPDYGETNELGATLDLPDFFWTGETDMNCLRQSIGQTLDEAYAHHIQRLMVIGNFALLAGIDPKQVNEWYLAVYADAYEWVEMPNTHGMALYADGGIMATKPYAASGKYINRMSDYCRNCRYDVKQTVGEVACPFNSLYWGFLDRHFDRFRRNHRMAVILRNLSHMDVDHLTRVRERTRELTKTFQG